MTNMIINVVEDFNAAPKGRYYPQHGDWAGERFRDKIMIPKMRNAIDTGQVLLVELDGYNRYGPSFIDEAFGALASIGGFSMSDLRKHLKIRHTILPSYEAMAWARIEFHEKHKEKIVADYNKRIQTLDIN